MRSRSHLPEGLAVRLAMSKRESALNAFSQKIGEIIAEQRRVSDPKRSAVSMPGRPPLEPDHTAASNADDRPGAGSFAEYLMRAKQK